jgi:hypothetical protein
VSETRFGPVKSFAILLRKNDAPGVAYEHVVLDRTDDDPPTPYLPLFHDAAVAEAWVAAVAGRGIDAEPIALSTGDALSTLLAFCRGRGVAHVAVDPQPGAVDLVPIERAIIGFELSG